MAVTWKHSFEIPMFEAVHTTIHAFMRTSEYGGWQPDPNLVSDVFVLNYCRGKPATHEPPGKFRQAFEFGHRWRPSYAEYVRANWTGWKDPTVELTVRLRPMPNLQRIKVLLEHRLTGPYAELIAQIDDGIGIRFGSETLALWQYLKESYGFDETPSLTNEQC